PRPAGTVMSAEPDVARVQPAAPTSLFLMGVSPGRTTVVAITDAGTPIVQYDVTVTPGATGTKPTNGLPLGMMPAAPAASAAPTRVTAETVAAIRSAILQSIPGAAGVQVQPAGTNVVLTGSISTPAASLQAEAIARGFIGDKGGVIDRMEVLSSIQVNVRVRIAEINRQITRQLGFNWQALGSGNPWKFGLFTGGAAAGPISALVPGGATALNGAVANQVGGGFTNSNWDVNGLIDALAADQLVTILAEPNLTAQSGETASFLAGGEYPIPVAGAVANGAVQISVDFKQYGVSLSVVPTVLGPNRLNLRIRPEVSQLTSTGAVSMPVGTGTITIPALTVRRAETTIELGSGQSFAIAGLLQRTSTDIANALPYLGELPVLGTLFKSTQFQRGDSELVIIVTPYIVRPVSTPAQLRAPTDHFVPATDLDRILFGRQMASDGTAPGTMAALPQGAGFILK
ncbi:MAG TPA: type II and III secretion system protein family protein, partial [Acetobacteraceae bacterium]|nr:type II and III secretion system protein family protein [Acetobacteraceae bacterium]